MQLDELKEINKTFENSMSLGDKGFRNKIKTLETNLESVSNLYQGLLSQKTMIHNDNNVTNIINCFTFF